MKDDIAHLTAGAAELLAEPKARRIRAIRSRRWVLYPRAKQALDRLEAGGLSPIGGKSNPKLSMTSLLLSFWNRVKTSLKVVLLSKECFDRAQGAHTELKFVDAIIQLSDTRTPHRVGSSRSNNNGGVIATGSAESQICR